VLSVRLAATGAHGEAHEAAAKALGYYQTLTAANPATHRPELGRSLLSLSHRLGQLGRHPEAAAAAEEATGNSPTACGLRPSSDIRHTLGIRSV
jgi:hypothetical protein